jgi:PST family polysaccharide transporter
MVSPLSQAVYPRISFLMHHARDEAFEFIRKVFRIQAAATLGLSVALFVSAPQAVDLVLGPGYQDAIGALRWMSPLPFLIGLSNVLGIQTMLPMGMNTAFVRVLTGAGILHLIVMLPLGYAFGSAGAGASVLVSEFVVTTAMAIHLWRRDVPVFSDVRRGRSRQWR